MRRPRAIGACLFSHALRLTLGAQPSGPLASCPGYRASNLRSSPEGLVADLTLAGPPCNVYGDDVVDLTLTVTYETKTRLHVKIQDAGDSVYQVPESVLPRPESPGWPSATADLKFRYTADPFSFAVSRTRTGEVLFDTSGAELVFQSQYLRLRTGLPEDPYLYGLGEHSDPFRLRTTDYVRTIWARDAYAVPEGTNLYSAHPVYYEHRTTGTHGVFLLNSNGMDVVINRTDDDGQFLEYNTLGGVLDFYFLSGPAPDDVARQYADVVGRPAMVPYWSLGFHQCRYGYQDVFDVAEVVYNYSRADIPLETIWTDIDYMDRRQVFTVDPERFPLDTMREFLAYLHAHDQHYVVMVDPAVAYQAYPPFERGFDGNIFLLRDNGSVWKGVVWPGVAVFPDWFAENITSYWDNEFLVFFSASDGLDIDGLWIDMNEPSNFPCLFPCDDPDRAAQGFPPKPPRVRDPPRRLPGFPCDLQPPGTCERRTRPAGPAPDAQAAPTQPREAARPRPRPLEEPGRRLGLPGRDLLYPRYAIRNANSMQIDERGRDHGGISNGTVNTDVRHQNGLAMYDTHNLYGTMMSTASRAALLRRRPAVRPLVITRSTFAGAGAHVGHWLGDNESTWAHYRRSIAAMLNFAALFQVPMVGSDVCGFGGDTTEALCARWALLGAFQPFFRNHNNLDSRPQEFYRWPAVAAAARRAIALRYRLLDYLYTALHEQSRTGTPLLRPVWFLYPADRAAWALDLQYFYGPALLVAPVTAPAASSVDVYLPADLFYDFHTGARLQGRGALLHLPDQGPTDLPLFVRGGAILPLRATSAPTTAALRTRDFELLVAPDADGRARGSLYLDDGVSLVQPAGVTDAEFVYADGVLTAQGSFAFRTDVKIARVTVLGLAPPGRAGEAAGLADGGGGGGGMPRLRAAEQTVLGVDEESGAVSFAVELALTEGFRVELLV